MALQVALSKVKASNTRVAMITMARDKQRGRGDGDRAKFGNYGDRMSESDATLITD